MNKVFFGDCRESMTQMIADGVKVQMCVTSPPYYGLRDYGHDGQLGQENSPEEFITNMVSVFSLVRDLLKEDGLLWLNIGDSYYNYRPGHGQRLGKQSIAGQKASHVEICPKRSLKLKGLKEKDLIGIPWMLAFALRSDGWYLRQDIIWSKPGPMPESVQDRCTKSHEYIFLLSKSGKYFYNNEAIKERAVRPNEKQTFGGAKARNGQQTGGDPRNGHRTDENSQWGKDYITEETRNKRSVWEVNTKPYSGAHFAVFPEKLIEPCILAGSRPGDIVLDPFFGSGTTGQVCQSLGRQWIGCELNREYEALQLDRTAQRGMVFT